MNEIVFIKKESMRLMILCFRDEGFSFLKLACLQPIKLHKCMQRGICGGFSNTEVNRWERARFDFTTSGYVCSEKGERRRECRIYVTHRRDSSI